MTGLMKGPVAGPVLEPYWRAIWMTLVYNWGGTVGWSSLKVLSDGPMEGPSEAGDRLTSFMNVLRFGSCQETNVLCSMTVSPLTNQYDQDKSTIRTSDASMLNVCGQ